MVTTVGIVDYGMGNHASVKHTLNQLGFRVRVGHTPDILDSVDLMVLPGVGAFSSAMQQIAERGLHVYLKDQVRRQRPLIGICLGMQLLATVGHEHGYTAGLDLIPGEVKALGQPQWHIGWNNIECLGSDSLLLASDGDAFYFNHSYVFESAAEYVTAIVRHERPVTAVVRRGNVVGVQFHPEKSQAAGQLLLKNLIKGLIHA